MNGFFGVFRDGATPAVEWSPVFATDHGIRFTTTSCEVLQIPALLGLVLLAAIDRQPLSGLTQASGDVPIVCCQTGAPKGVRPVSVMILWKGSLPGAIDITM